MAKQHFPFKHPTFGTIRSPKSPNYWKVSVYYWWFEYLRRNSEYKKTCDLQGADGKCVKLYSDFGDVHSSDFKKWWSTDDRGARLFAEPPAPNIRVVSGEQLERMASVPEASLILNVPLTLPITFLVKDFRKVLVKHHSGKRGQRRVSQSQAQYVPGGKVDVAFFEIALSVWDARQREPKKPLWMIAKDLGIGGKHRLRESDTPATQSDKKNILAATAGRYVRKASRMIELTGLGRFPH